MKGAKYILWVLLLVMAKCVFAQVGNNLTPMQYATHTYRITMGAEGNIPLWRIYSGHLSVNQIESGSFTALQRNVDYTVLADEISTGDAVFTVEYNGNMDPGAYTICYKENNEDECFKTEILEIDMQSPFDVDMTLADAADAANCPDMSAVPQQSGTLYQTTIPYRIEIVYPLLGGPEGGYAGEWSFNYQVSADGQGALDNARIAAINFDYGDDLTNDLTHTPAGNVSSYSGSVTVPNNNPDAVQVVVMYVTFNDVLGVAQDISVELSGIEGSWYEVDSDLNNSVSNTIFSMPAAGDINALN